MTRAQPTASPWQQTIKPLLVRMGLKGGLLLLLVSALYWFWLQTAALLPVKQVSVTGVMQQVSSTELRDVVKPLLQDGLIRMDVQVIRDAVESLPWVSRVTVRRQWPDTLALVVEEQQQLARWGDDALVNLRGELFYPSTIEVDATLPRFDGVDGLSKVMAEAYQQYQPILADVELSIAVIKVSERRAWVIELANGIELVLGRGPQNQRIQRFITVYRSGLAEKAERISRVDLRYSNGFSVSWKENKVG